MNYKKISIITVTWNRAKLLEEAIKNVMNQNYPNYEHIIIDNASNDGTIDILKKYPNLKWISEPDRGQSEAMNKGLKMANGDIFAWMNDDDLYPEGTFDLINKEFDLAKYSFIYGTCNIIGSYGQKIGQSNFHKFNRNALMMGYNNVNTPAVFASLSLIKKLGFMDESLYATFDLDMWIRLSKIKKPYPLKKVTSNLRLHDGSGLMSAKVHLKEKALIRKKYISEVPLYYRMLFEPYYKIKQFLYDHIKMRIYGFNMNK